MWMHRIFSGYSVMSMSKQILLCVEANKQSRTDYQYIQAVIKRFYADDRKIVYRPIFMGSKTKYNAKDVVRDVDKRIKEYSGITHVIYFIDTDDYNTSPETRRLYDDIASYCGANGFDLVFFCRDVEDVFIGHQIRDSEKIRQVAVFNRKNIIEDVDASKLRSNEHRLHCSNILNVMDKYWKRK